MISRDSRRSGRSTSTPTLPSRSGAPMEAEDYEDEAVQDFLQILDEHCRNCERTGRYVEASIAKKRRDELFVHQERRMREALKSRQIAERLGVEEAHMIEFQQFQLVYDRKMAEFEENAARLILAMKERHASELRKFQQRLVAKSSITRLSKEYLNLRKVQETLAKQKLYADAARVKEKGDQLKAYEEEQEHSLRQAEAYRKERAFKRKLSLELMALKKRIEMGKMEQKRQRQIDLERLLQRYQNVKRELEQQHRLERMKHEKAAKARAAARAAKM